MSPLRALPVVVILLLVRCHSEPPPVVVQPDAFDLPAATATVVARGGLPTVLMHSSALLGALIVPGQTIDPSKGAGNNGDALAAQASKLAAQCQGVKVTHVPGTNSVGLSLPVANCAIGELPFSGFVDVTVASKDGTTSLVVKLTAVKARSHQIDGTIALSTTDGTAFETTLTLQFDTLQWSWQGSLTPDANKLGALFAGKGSVKTKEGESIAVAVEGLHHNFAACYANAGTLALTWQVALTAPKAKAGTLLDATATVAFNADSPRDGSVAVSLTVGALKPVTQKSVTLPKYGDCPDGTAP